jgi:cytochrome c-type biogenesis protein CcmH
VRYDIALLILLAAFSIGLACWWAVRGYAPAGDGARRQRGPWAAAAVAGAAVVGVYLLIGSPSVPDGAYADRMAALSKRDPRTFSADEVAAVLSAAARRHPGDPRPLIFLGEVEAGSGRAEPALRAFQEALRRDPDSVEAMIGLGRVIVAMRQGEVTREARELFERAAERVPAAPEPWLYQALAARQEGRAQDARRLWRETLTRLPANDPRRAMVTRMLEAP